MRGCNRLIHKTLNDTTKTCKSIFLVIDLLEYNKIKLYNLILSNNEVFPLDERNKCFQRNYLIEIDDYIIII